MAPINPLRQPMRRLPLVPLGIHRVQDSGVVGLRCRARLHLAVDSGSTPTPVSFVVDSGASYSMMSLDFAECRQITINLLGPEIVLQPTTAQGTTPMLVRPGRVRAWWNDELSGYPFDCPILFRVGAPAAVPPILGLGGVVKTCRWTFEGEHSLEAPYGCLQLEDMR